jgi:hypothetical protein
MSLFGKPREVVRVIEINEIPLWRAVLCADCDTISDSATDHCPGCGSHGSLLSLSRIVEGRSGRGQVLTFRRNTQ